MRAVRVHAAAGFGMVTLGAWQKGELTTLARWDARSSMRSAEGDVATARGERGTAQKEASKSCLAVIIFLLAKVLPSSSFYIFRRGVVQ
jgi:hypothetical protein